LGELVSGEALERLAGALAAGFFLGGEIFFRAAEELGGGEELAFAAGGEVELVEFERGIAGRGTEEEGVFAVGRKLGGDRAAEGVIAGLSEVAEVGELGVFGGQGGARK
jgi:hypothetical protein